uniref:Uncharacterized protein n=1 Tax=Amphimedon queenslandica TaxID=400682 RepID=A0A1X7TAR6_AMPQE
MISESRCRLKIFDHLSPEEDILSASSVTVGGPIYMYLPLNKDQEFSLLRCKFGSAFFAANCAIQRKNINPDQMRMLLSDCFPHKPEFSNKHFETTNDILDAVKRNCNLIDINCLEVIVKQFNVSEAFDPLEAYKAEVEEFCKVLRDELNESLEVVRSPRPLSRETIVLVLDQIPLTCTVCDIKDIVQKALGVHIGDVRIMSVSDSHFIAIKDESPDDDTSSSEDTVMEPDDKSLTVNLVAVQKGFRRNIVRLLDSACL